MTIFQATLTIVITVVASQIGIIIFTINRLDNLARDLRVEIQGLRAEVQNLTRELRVEIL